MVFDSEDEGVSMLTECGSRRTVPIANGVDLPWGFWVPDDAGRLVLFHVSSFEFESWAEGIAYTDKGRPTTLCPKKVQIFLDKMQSFSLLVCPPPSGFAVLAVALHCGSLGGHHGLFSGGGLSFVLDATTEPVGHPTAALVDRGGHLTAWAHKMNGRMLTDTRDPVPIEIYQNMDCNRG